MLTSYNFEGKSKEEAINKCLEELKLTQQEIYIKESETEQKLFKAKKYLVSAFKKEDILKYIKAFLKELELGLNISINSEVRYFEESINIVLVSDSNNVLIGKEGRTIDSIQILLRQSLNNLTGLNIKVNVDASNYKANKMKNLEYEIRKIAQDVLKNKVEVKLDPMNSYERRIAHSVISEYPKLQTISYGEGLERHVVISYKEAE